MTYQNSKTSLSKLDLTSEQQKQLSSRTSKLLSPKKPQSKSDGLGLRTKVILTAIALSIIPVTTIGLISYKVTQSKVTQQINKMQESRTNHLALTLEKYLSDRTKEAETLASSPIFTNPNVMETVTVGQKKAALDSFQSKTGFYDSIVYLDLQGNPLFQSQSEFPLRENYSEQEYFQTAIEKKKTTLNELGISSYTGKPRIEFAIPVKNAWTDEVIGVMRFRIPSQEIISLFEDYVTADEHWYVINTQGIIFASNLDNLNNKPLNSYLSELQAAHISQESVTKLVNNPKNAREQMINYVPVKIGAINPELNLGTAIALDTDIAFATLKSLKWIYLGGTIGTVLLVGSLAGFLANRIVQPLLKLIFAVKELAQGKLNTRIELDRRDELAVLGAGINDMAIQLDETLRQQKTIARTSELLARISQARTSRELQLPFSLFLAEVRNAIQSDRLVFYQFDSQWWGTVVAESVAQGFPRTLGVQFDDPCFAQDYVRKYQRGRIQAVSDIQTANLTSCHLRQLEPYQVKASVVLPVILERSSSQSSKLIGLLIAHQCSDTRIWSQSDVDYLQQIAYQLAAVLKGYIVSQEDTLQQTSVQQDAAQILNQMKQLAAGDLRDTLKQEVNVNEVNFNNVSSGDLSQSFAGLLDNLRQTIEDIKTPSQVINRDLTAQKQDQVRMQDSLQQQTNQLALIFAFIEQISSSITEVSSQVGVASHTVDSVVKDLESEKVNFSHAIAFMSQLEANLRNNRDKVKNLRIASQKISKVINSIRKINLRASLLANKLSKRIPELDESAFSLKEEIKAIQQSIAATKELEIVASGIDREIAQVLQEYQKNENNLEQENYLVANASQNLERIVKVTKNAQQNLFSLVNMTKVQSQTSQRIGELKEELYATSGSINRVNDRTIQSLEETSLTAKDLENAIDFFKL